MKRKAATWVLLMLVWTGCARAVSAPREAYILSRPHGWLEISIDDQSVPEMPLKRAKGDNEVLPAPCRITVKVNAEHYLSDTLYPLGPSAPFSLKTGFRIAVPEGESRIELIYSACRVVENELRDHRVSGVVNVQTGYVTPIDFDGVLLTLGDAEKDLTVTLEDINDRLKYIKFVIESSE